jgi:myo-inositol-1(or 4)-monophosphatase
MANISEFWQQIRQDAEYLVREGGKILSVMQSSFSITQKKDAVDLVTTADLASEKFIVDYIKDKYPDHSIYSEEVGNIDKKSDYRWIIDPLDGTKEYSKGFNIYNCLVAVEYKGQIIAAAIQRNGVNELYSAAFGFGSTLLNQKIHVSECNELSLAFIGIHLPTNKSTKKEMDREMELVQKLILRSYRIRPNWDDANSCVWVARGVTDAYLIGPNLPGGWHDVAPAILIAQEAGAKVTNWLGQPIVNHDLSQGIIVSNSRLHDDLLRLVNELH